LTYGNYSSTSAAHAHSTWHLPHTCDSHAVTSQHCCCCFAAQQAQKLEEKLRQINEELPTRISNVCGSCAGAGSGDFHYYRQVGGSSSKEVEWEQQAAGLGRVGQQLRCEGVVPLLLSCATQMRHA
jgi:hypothetical protein